MILFSEKLKAHIFGSIQELDKIPSNFKIDDLPESNLAHFPCSPWKRNIFLDELIEMVNSPTELKDYLLGLKKKYGLEFDFSSILIIENNCRRTSSNVKEEKDSFCSRFLEYFYAYYI